MSDTQPADKKRSRKDVLSALVFSVIVQGCLFLFSGFIMDTGNINRLVAVSTVFFWSALLGVFLVRLVKPRPPSGFDLALIKYGFLLFLVLMPFLDQLAYVIKTRLGLL